MGDILGKVPFYANGRQRKKEDSDERNDNTFIFFAGRLWKAAAPLFDKDRESKIKALFINLFIQQNRIQTAYDKVSAEISTKQWLLLGITANCPEPKTLTRIGQLMGCSRQNVKQLADSLEKRGYIEIKKGTKRCVCLELTDKARQYHEEIYNTRSDFLNRLYSVFSDEEITQLYKLQTRLFDGIEAVEEYTSDKQSENRT